jgi:hypothetical protein
VKGQGEGQVEEKDKGKDTDTDTDKDTPSLGIVRQRLTLDPLLNQYRSDTSVDHWPTSMSKDLGVRLHQVRFLKIYPHSLVEIQLADRQRQISEQRFIDLGINSRQSSWLCYRNHINHLIRSYFNHSIQLSCQGTRNSPCPTPMTVLCKHAR